MGNRPERGSGEILLRSMGFGNILSGLNLFSPFREELSKMFLENLEGLSYV